jgi:hypothetical protein
MFRSNAALPMVRQNLLAMAKQRTTTPMVLRAAASTHAISNPTLANIEKRWDVMQPQDQAELWMALRDRMKENWKELTLQEKKAGELKLAVYTRRSIPSMRCATVACVSWLVIMPSLPSDAIQFSL